MNDSLETCETNCIDNKKEPSIDVSIIIVNWNTCDILQDCLKSVYEQTKDLSFEVIVVDNASSDDSVEVIKRDFPQVVLIENPENRGFATANNQGVAISKGRYILLLNSDTVVLDGAIQKTIAFADRHPEAAVVGCKVLNPDRTIQPTCFVFPSLLNLFLSATYLYKVFHRSRFFGQERMTWWDRSDVRGVDVVTGCFMLVRREAIDQLGMMDEEYFMYAEETDWCYRFKKAGWKILFTPDPQIIHLGGQSSQKVKSEMVLQLRASRLLFLKKHRSYIEYLVGCFLTSMFFLLRVPVWLLLGIFSRKKRKRCFMTARIYLSGYMKSLLGYEALTTKKFG